MTKEEIKSKLKEFLIEEMAKDEINDLAENDYIDFDSIEQVELRVFLEEEFSVVFTEKDEPFSTLEQIVNLVTERLKLG